MPVDDEYLGRGHAWLDVSHLQCHAALLREKERSMQVSFAAVVGLFCHGSRAILARCRSLLPCLQGSFGALQGFW